MNKIIGLIWFFARSFFLTQGLKRLKRKGVLVYLQVLQGVRQALKGAIAVFVVVQLMVFGLLGTFVTGVWLAPAEAETKLWIIFGVSLAVFTIPLALLLYIFSEKVWFELSGAKTLVAPEED